MTFYLIYLSKANTYISMREINNILAHARCYNKEHNITGMLLFHNDSFLQVLEGKQQDVDELYNKIKHDPRHTCIQNPLTGQTNERTFAAWSMGFTEIENQDREFRITGLIDYIEALSNEEALSSKQNILNFLHNLNT